MPESASRPTITPSFPEFLPSWVSRQPWYQGSGGRLTLTGSYRLEDPAGEVGMETHLLRDGDIVYQVPMTYRGAPRPDAPPEALIVHAEHSVLGPRWIYDAETDPVWRAELLRFVRDGDRAAVASRNGEVADALRGRPVAPTALDASATIEIIRTLPTRAPSAPEPVPAGVTGLLAGTYRLGTGDGTGSEAATATALLAVIR